MNIFETENFFGNSSFVFLFVSMISYWVQISFSLKKWNVGRISMIIANFCLLSLLILRWKESGHFPLSNLYESLMFLSWSLSAFHLILENIEFGTNKNGFFQTVEKNVQTQNFSPNLPPKKGSGSRNLQKQSFVGAFTAPTALFINAFATFRLPIEMQQSAPLVPALQSNWLMMHVTVMILSYAALICGSLLSIAFLIVTKNFEPQSGQTAKRTSGPQSGLDLNIPKNSNLLQLVPISNAGGPQISKSESVEVVTRETGNLSPDFGEKPPTSLSGVEARAEQPAGLSFASQTPNFGTSWLPEKALQKNGGEVSQTNFNIGIINETSFKTKFAENLDNLSYRILGIGFPLLTIGILSGAVWANEAWGSYWSWDPKETWALATWFVFAIYLHTRLTKGWSGKKPAIIASIGFLTVWVCFLGVNLLGEGLHSYGFLKDSF